MDSRKFIPCFLILGTILLLSCGRLEGNFAYKKQLDDHYRKMGARPQFHMDDRVKWVYVFEKFRGSHEIGVILLKKEVVWIDVLSWHETIRPKNNIIYGTIENFEEGEYKIILTENDKVFAEQHLLIYDH